MDEDFEEGFDEDGTGKTEGAACLPRLVFFLLACLLTALLAVEIWNGLRHPSILQKVPGNGEGRGPVLTFYQFGNASARTAWLFDEPAGTAGPPRLIQQIDLRNTNTRLGEIRWTGDGRAVYAAGRVPRQRNVPEILWLFEFGPGRLFVRDPSDALPSRTVYVEDAAALTARWRSHQGAGEVAAHWYDLGAKGPRLYSWQTTRWAQAGRGVPPLVPADES